MRAPGPDRHFDDRRAEDVAGIAESRGDSGGRRRSPRRSRTGTSRRRHASASATVYSGARALRGIARAARRRALGRPSAPPSPGCARCRAASRPAGRSSPASRAPVRDSPARTAAAAGPNGRCAHASAARSRASARSKSKAPAFFASASRPPWNMPQSTRKPRRARVDPVARAGDLAGRAEKADLQTRPCSSFDAEPAVAHRIGSMGNSRPTISVPNSSGEFATSPRKRARRRQNEMILMSSPHPKRRRASIVPRATSPGLDLCEGRCKRPHTAPGRSGARRGECRSLAGRRTDQNNSAALHAARSNQGGHRAFPFHLDHHRCRRRNGRGTGRGAGRRLRMPRAIWPRPAPTATARTA